MTNRWPSIAGTALCTLLAVATSASAECAWVLWEKYSSSDKPDTVWTIRGAHENRHTCDAALARDMANSRAMLGEKVKRSGTDWLQVGQPASPAPWVVAYTYFQCLPDTVDPRGPTGK